MKITSNQQIKAISQIAEKNQSKILQQRSISSAPDKATISPLGKSLSGTYFANKSGESIANIMSGKSLRNISYSDLVNLAEKLRDSGHLAEKDFLDFIGPPPKYATLDGSVNPNGDAPMDYIGNHEKNVAFMTSNGSEQRFIDFEKYLLNLYISFEGARQL